jgi:ribosomal protein S18 acetylase RimI-like enzyme
MKATPALIDDAPEIAKLHVRSWQAAYAGIFEPAWLAALSVDDRAKRWRDIISADESHTLVSHQDGHLSGFVSFGKCREEGAGPDQGEVFALYVRPQFWGRGCGRALLRHAAAQLRTDGFTSTSLWVLCANRRGIGFYEASGFKRVTGSEKVFEMGGRQVEEVAYLRQHECGP